MVQLADRNLSGTYRVDRLGVPRWSSGKLEQKERKTQYEQSSFNGETDTGSGSTIFSGRVSHCSGKIQTGSYTNKDGIKVYTTEVVVEEQEFAESRAEQGRENQGAMGAPDANGFQNIPDGINEELPFH